jgi:multiple sugar transport system substrate-binding protein
LLSSKKNKEERKMKKRVLAIIMASLMCVTVLAGCGNGGNTASKGSNVNNGTSTLSDAQSGKVVVAVSTGRTTDTYNLFKNFNKYYPNIQIEVKNYDSTTSAYLTAQAASGTMPDVVFDDASTLYYYVSQGWVYPLNDFVKDDKEFSYVPKSIVDSYTYGNKLYALPMQAHFSSIFINEDLLNKLNMDMPSLDWTPDDYKAFLKKGTTNEYSGTEILWGVDEVFAGSMDKNASYYGYDMKDNKFNLSNTWVKAVNLMRELRTYPGLEAWTLRNSSSTADSNDYAKKFGKGDQSDIHMAFKMGKILSGPRGTWDVAWLKDLSYKWTLWPWPQAEDAKGHLPMHVDNTWVVSTTKNPKAAFEAARFFTYSQEGNLERLSMYETGDTSDYKLNNDFYIPTTNDPKVAEHFKALPNISDGIKYMYDNMSNSFRADLTKIVPGWDQVNSQYLSIRGDKVRDGVDDPASVAAELDNVATKAIQNYWNIFQEKLTKVQADFDNSHSKK